MGERTGRHRRKRREWQFGDFDPRWKLPLDDEMSSRLLFFDHDFRGLDYCRNCVPYLEVHFNRASPGDYALDVIISNLDDHVVHDSARLEFSNPPLKASSLCEYHKT